MKTLMDYANISRHINAKLGIGAIVVLVATPLVTAQGFATDWTTINSNIENGSIDRQFHVYIGNEKSPILTQTTFQQQNISNLAGKLSDNSYQANTDIKGFHLNIEQARLTNKMLVLVGGSYAGNVEQNQLNLTDITDGYDLEVRGGHSYKGKTQGNKVVIQRSVIDHVYGSTSRIGTADDNNVMLSDNAEVRIVHGGRTWFSKNGAKNNKVEVSGSIASWIYGGESQGGEVSNNNVILRNAGSTPTLARGVIGGKSVTGSKADVHHNEVQIIGSNVEKSDSEDSAIYGGFAAYGNADHNKVSIASAKHHQVVIETDVFGANNQGHNSFGRPAATANHNQVNIMGAIIKGDVYGAKSAAADTNGNTVNIQGDHAYQADIQSVYGGYTISGSASHNRLTINRAQVAGDIYGGYIHDGYEKQAAENHITLANVNVKGNVYGGYNSGTESRVINNVVDLKENVDISGEVVGGLAESNAYGGSSIWGSFGGFSGLSNLGSFGSNTQINSDVVSGNTLNLYSDGVRVKNIKNFSVYNVILPSELTANSNILTTTGSDDTDLSGSKINVIFPTVVNLKVGEGINLVKTEKGKLLLDDKTQTHVTSSGLINDYQFDIQQSDNHTLRAILKSKNANAYGNSTLNVATLSTEITGRLWDSMDDTLGSLTSSNLQTEWTTFANAGGFKTRYGERSMEMSGTTFSTGIAVKRNTQTYGGFIENAYANYHSKQGEIAFDGRIRAYGAGVFGYFNLPNHFYTKGILKAGKIQTRNNGSASFNYKLSMPYYNAGLSLGLHQPFGALIWDNSLAYIYSYAGHDRTTINHQEILVKHTKANKLKAQTQLIYQNGMFQPFAKLKFDYKLNNTAEIVALPDDEGIYFDNRGGNFGGEIGFRYLPMESVQVNLNLGYMNGKREETSGKIEFMYAF